MRYDRVKHVAGLFYLMSLLPDALYFYWPTVLSIYQFYFYIELIVGSNNGKGTILSIGKKYPKIDIVT